MQQLAGAQNLTMKDWDCHMDINVLSVLVMI